MNQQEHIELFQGLQVNKVEINDEDRLENYCATAEKYRDDDEGNQAEIEHKHGSKNYCVNAEKYRDEDESNSAKINAENRPVNEPQQQQQQWEVSSSIRQCRKSEQPRWLRLRRIGW